MKLTELNPRWLSFDTGRRGQGIAFDCPCEKCQRTKFRRRVTVPFANPLDGKARAAGREDYWTRDGDEFETLTLSPSIDESECGHWHGTVRQGEVFNA